MRSGTDQPKALHFLGCATWNPLRAGMNKSRWIRSKELEGLARRHVST
jgi:hypothetical protein